MTKRNNERIKLDIYGIAYTEIGTITNSKGTYILILTQEEGSGRIPIIIGEAESQAIALGIEHKKASRPITHDMFVTFAQGFGIQLIDVLINRYEDGIFYCDMTFFDGTREVVVDCRTSDAISIALRVNAPIYTTQEVMDEAGFNATFDEELKQKLIDRADNNFSKAQDKKDISVAELEKELNKLVEDEQYEEAAKIKAILIEKKNK